MALVSAGSAHWEGGLQDGSGTATLESSGLATLDVSWKARTEGTSGMTSPEELIAAAHSACYSMALSGGLARAGTPPKSLDTRAEVTFAQIEGGWGITTITLRVRAVVPGLTAEDFADQAEAAKTGCPVSRALAGVPEILLDAELVEG